jgi:hypothetical protein
MQALPDPPKGIAASNPLSLTHPKPLPGGDPKNAGSLLGDQRS